ncbi:hypothetical protein BGZ57DRAFT_895380 [Hyaloscypha finlandica]|nr:hypothetical protein BGZ57DRAFT_895380 [Hyaloscypha finlandica]
MATTSTYPEGTQFWQTADYKGNLLRDLNASLIAISTFILGTRLYVRLVMTKNPGLDDIFASIAWAVICSQSALDIVEVKNGSGAHLELIPMPTVIKFFELLVTQNLIYFWAVGLMRLAVVAFLPRLGKEKLYLYLIYATAAIIVIQTNFAFWYKLCECRPIKDLWKPPFETEGLNCVSAKANDNMMVSHAVIGIIMDVVLMVLPIWMVWKNMMFTKKAIQVILIFSVGIFVIVTGIVRLWYIKTLVFAIDPTYKMATIGVWTDLEGHVGLWVGCFPAMQPIIRMVSYKLGLRSKLLSYGATPTKNTNAVSASNKAVQRPTHGYLRSGNGVDRAGTDTDADSQKAIIASDYSVELGQIRKQTDLEVKVEERVPGGEKGSRLESWANV